MAILKRFTSTVLNIVRHEPDIMIITFSTPEDFSFEAGEFVNIKLDSENGPIRRSYSILSPPSNKNKIDIALKIIKDGEASTIFDKLKVDEELEITGPMGHLKFESEEKEHWFLGAGTGIAPLYSIICEYVPKYPSKKFVLLWGAKYKTGLFLLKEIKELESKFSNFEFIPVVSRENWDGKNGHVQDYLPKDLHSKMFYICGLKELVLETESILKDKGIEKSKLKKERYS